MDTFANSKYRGIIFMLFAALGFSIMGGAAKSLTGIFNAGQLVFYRNLIGLIILLISFSRRPAVNTGGKFHLLLFRGLMGTTALYTLLYCILHIPLGTAMTYSLTSAIFIAIFSFFLFKEFEGVVVLLAVLLGFAGMLFVYKPSMHYPWFYHLAGLVSGITSAFAYLTVGKLVKYYDTRIIVLSFILMGVLVPTLSMLLHYVGNIPIDNLLIIDWKWPVGWQWFPILLIGLAALFGQYFVTLAYGADRAGIVSAIGYSNIIFSIFIGMLLGDAFPDLISLTGICCIIGSGLIISLVKKRS